MQAAMRRFPTRGLETETLLARDENFRGICDDLAAAEEALAATERLPENLRAARRREYEELVADLAEEIARALERANVFQIPRIRRPDRGDAK
ncbi:hypothetical protein J2Z31_003525 [Sinorhizobium kostiense]|uniref:Uncharacterized protein n=2 Tax=Sinorhizobium kostiense TaxID=76747 RepID=A0ABS4R3N6_9HYPH|nr:hypothetical protein [Sinorhizobium kostiense]